MKQTIQIPDKEIQLTQGDHVKIYINKKDIDFAFYCDGTGNIFTLTKKELMEMCK